MLLVKHGSDIYMKNREGNDALEICLNLNHVKLAKQLADTKKLKDEFMKRAKSFYEGLMGGDAEYYDPRYGGGAYTPRMEGRWQISWSKRFSRKNLCHDYS